MDDEHTPQSYLSTNYIPLEIDIEKSSDPPPHSKTSTWRYDPNHYLGYNITLILTQRQILQVRAFRCALRCDGSGSYGLFGLS